MTPETETLHPIDALALDKIGHVPENFRLYYWGWVELNPPFKNFKVTGAVFRPAKSGPRKGELVFKIKGTERHAFFTSAELKANRVKEAT